MKNKFELYQEQGVKEYWVVNPVEQNILVYVLKNKKYIGIQPVVDGDEITSPTFPILSFSTAGLYDL